MGRRSETPSATEESSEDVPTAGRTPRSASKRKTLKEVDEESGDEVVPPSRKRKPVKGDKEMDADEDEEPSDDEAEKSEEEATTSKPSSSKKKRKSSRKSQPKDDADDSEESGDEVVTPSRKRKPVKDEESSEEEAEKSEEEATTSKPSSSKKKRKSGRKSQPKYDADDSENDENEKPLPKKSGREKKETTTKDEEQEYEVSKIVDDRAIKGRIQYKIRWKGYLSEDDTWENESTLDCDDLIEEYNDGKGDEARANGSSDPPATKAPKSKGKPAKADKKSKRQKPAASEGKSGRSKKDGHTAPDSNGEWEVSRLIDMHTLKNGSREFLVRWKGYPPEDDSWEPEEHLKGTDILERFLRKVEQAREASEKELRVRRKPTNFYTPAQIVKGGSRVSKRFVNKERAKYYDAE